MAMMKGKTPFMKAEDRLMAAFASEMEALGLKAHTNGISGSYRADGVFMAQLTTEPEPLKGNKGKVEALRAAGYAVEVYAPYNWNRRRGLWSGSAAPSLSRRPTWRGWPYEKMVCVFPRTPRGKALSLFRG